MLAKLNKLLLLLPFNGSKTKIGIVSVLLSLVLSFYPDFPLDESAINGIVDNIKILVDVVGVLYTSVGVLHKWIKAKV